METANKNSCRDYLQELCVSVRTMMRKGHLQSQNLNQALIELYKNTNPDVKDLQTFLQWKNAGYKVVKGAKAFVIWGSKQTDKAGNPYYPLCYLFSDKQVIKEK
jgi:hypothetical protein